MFGNTPRRIGDFVIKYRWAIIIINVLLIGSVIMAFGKRGSTYAEHNSYMQHIRNNPLDIDSAHVSPPPIFEGDYHVFFDADNPELLAYDHFQDTYSKEENLIIVVAAKNGNIFTEENLRSLKYMTDQAWTIPYVVRVDGLTNFNYTYVDDDDLLVEDFIEEVPSSQAELDNKKKTALADPLIPKFLLSKNADISQMQLRVIIPKDFPDGYMEARTAVEALKHKILSKTMLNSDSVEVANPMYNPNLDIKLGGTVMLNTAFQKFAMDDVQNLMPLMFLFIILVLAITIRSVGGTLLPMLLLFTSVLFPVALFIGVFDFSFTNPTMNVTQMLTAVAIADSVHVLAIFYRGLRNGLDKLDAVRFTIEKNFLPCLITSITTAIGFFSLMMQDIPPFRDLGMFAGVGVIYAFLASLYTMPAILAVLPFKKRESKKEDIKEYEEKGYEKLSHFVYNNRKALFWTGNILALFGIYFSTQIKIDNNPVKYFDDHTEFYQATNYIDENIIGVNAVEFQFDSGEENGIYDPKYLKNLERFQDYIASHKEFAVTYTSSIVDIIKRINKTMHGDDLSYYRIPDENELTAEGDTINAKRLIAQYLLLYQMSLPQGMSLTNQIDIRNRTTRVTAFAQSISSSKLLANAQIMNQWIEENIPKANAIALGVPVMFGQLMMTSIPSILESLLVSLLLITIVLMFTFKSIKIGLYSMIPNILPILITFGFIGLLGVEVNMSVAIVGMITLGIAVDDTVHYITKYLRGLSEGHDQFGAIQYAFRQVAAPLVFTSVILVAGFGALTQSDFVLNSDMALYSAIVISLALFADFILLPAIILTLDSTKTIAKKNSVEKTS